MELKTWEESQERLKAGTREKPVVVIHYWNQCGHCIAKKPMWDKFANKYGKDMGIYKLEQSKNGGNISSFPTYQINKGTGIMTVNPTEEKNPDDLKSQLLVGGRKKTRRMRARRLVNRRRKTAH